jgi:hypothetical protein
MENKVEHVRSKTKNSIWNFASHKYWAVSLHCNYSTDPSYNTCINPTQAYVRSTITTGCRSALANLHIYREIEIDSQARG